MPPLTVLRNPKPATILASDASPSPKRAGRINGPRATDSSFYALGGAMNNAIVTGLFTLAGVAIGFGGQFFLRSKELNERRKSLANAIAAEIEAYLDLMKRRDVETYAQQIININKKGNRHLPKVWISGFEKGAEPFPVLKSTLSEIGLLGDANNLVSKFYSQAMAVRITIMSIDEGKYENAIAKDLAVIFEQELKLWKDTVKVGREAVAKLLAAAG